MHHIDHLDWSLLASAGVSSPSIWSVETEQVTDFTKMYVPFSIKWVLCIDSLRGCINHPKGIKLYSIFNAAHWWITCDQQEDSSSSLFLLLIYFRLTSVHTYRLTFMAVRKKVRLGIVGETIHKDGRVFFQYAWETTHLLWRSQEEEGSPLYSVLYSLKGKACDFKHKNGGCISMHEECTLGISHVIARTSNYLVQNIEPFYKQILFQIWRLPWLGVQSLGPGILVYGHHGQIWTDDITLNNKTYRCSVINWK